MIFLTELFLRIFLAVRPIVLRIGKNAEASHIPIPVIRFSITAAVIMR